MAILGIGAAIDGVEACGDAAAEIRMGRPNTRIDDIHRDALALAGVPVKAIQRQTALIDPVQPPGRIRLDAIGADPTILLNQRHRRILRQRPRRRHRHLRHQPIDRMAPARFHVHPMPRRHLPHPVWLATVNGLSVEQDDVLSGNGHRRPGHPEDPGLSRPDRQ